MSPVIPPPRESGQTTRTALPLHWAAWGPAGAPRLLVLHGGPGAHHDYLLPQLLHLAERHDCLFYDQRGGGRSKHDDAPLHLVGYSWGGLLALLYAIEAAEGGHALPVTLEPVGTAHPAPRRRPASLTLIDPAPITRAWRVPFEAEMAQRAQSPAVQAMRAELAASGLRERDPDAYRQRSFELSVAGYFHDPARARDLTPFRVTGRVQQSVWESLGEYDLRPHLATLDVPTMVVHGREDPIPLASSEALAAGIPGAALVVLDDCGHVPYVEQPAALFAALDPWLARVVG